MTLPRITLGDLEVSRLIVGGNPFSAISHQSAERDKEMRDYFTVQRIKQTLRECEEAGINTFCGRADNHVMRLLNEYWNDGGTIHWLAQTAPERANLHQNIEQAARAGARAIYIQGGTVDSAHECGTMEELGKAIELVKSLGCVAGLAGHDPRSHLKAQEMGLGAQFHMVCFYNLTGRRGRIDVEDPDDRYRPEDPPRAIETIHQMEVPCLGYKFLAAGRLDPREAVTFTFQNLRPTDGAVVGFCTREHPTQVADTVNLVLEVLAGAGVG